MRPGPHPWATNDAWAAGPDAASDSKTETTDIQREDGWYRGRRIGPDTFNWQMNRNYLAHQFASKLFASNWPVEYTDAAFGAANLVLGASAMRRDPSYNTVSAFFYDDTTALGSAIIEEVTTNNGLTWTTPARSPVLAAPGAVVAALDAAADDNADMTIVVADAPLVGGDLVYYSTGLIVNWLAATIVGGPALNWISVGCDCNTAGGANALFCIGDDPGIAPATPALYTATDPTAATGFVANASFAGLAGLAGEDVKQIEHTKHPAGALGPDDAGNPSWLVLTDTYPITSADGVTWAVNAAHNLGTPNAKSAAYSRTAGRWVAAVQGGAGATRYSDDNGVTWSAGGTLPGAGAGGVFQCKCDGYGTFVIKSSTAADDDMWVSSDEGLTWMRVHVDWTTPDEFELEVAAYSDNNWDDHGEFGTFFICVSYDDGATTLNSWRSLIY